PRGSCESAAPPCTDRPAPSRRDRRTPCSRRRRGSAWPPARGQNRGCRSPARDAQCPKLSCRHRIARRGQRGWRCDPLYWLNLSVLQGDPQQVACGRRNSDIIVGAVTEVGETTRSLVTRPTPPKRVGAQLVLVMDCDKPLAAPLRFSLMGLSEVVIGRGAE